MNDSTLHARLRRALDAPIDDLKATPYREQLLTLLDVYAVHLAPLEELGGAEVLQHEPRVARMKGRLEARFRARLDGAPTDHSIDDPVAAFRRVARDDLVPSVYDWLASAASIEELVEFLELEGGPDADFDDLVAMCQVGLRGVPKLTLGANYWDELGRGEHAAVHTVLHHDMAMALGMRAVPLDALPIEVLERKALGGYFATNRALQPEMIGGLGLLECQAGPRCRRVVAALHRVGAPAAALPFYEEHATADPRHGKEWIDHAIVPLVARTPEWGPRIVRGARWRATVNQRFFHAMANRFRCASVRAA